MSDPYGYGELPTTEALPWIRYSRWILWFCGAMYVLLGIGMGVFMPLGFMADPTIDDDAGVVMGGCFGVFAFGFSAAFGALNFAAASGLARRQKWAWIATIVLGGIYAPSICLPFGGALLYGMLQDDVRKAFKTG